MGFLPSIDVIKFFGSAALQYLDIQNVTTLEYNDSDFVGVTNHNFQFVEDHFIYKTVTFILTLKGFNRIPFEKIGLSGPTGPRKPPVTTFSTDNQLLNSGKAISVSLICYFVINVVL